MIRAAIAAFLFFTAGAMPAAADPSFVWSDLFDGGGSYTDIATAAITGPSGDLYVGGESADGVQGTDMSIRRLDRATGGLVWETRYSAFDGNDMALSELAGDGFGNIIVAGYIRGCAT